MDFVRWFRQHDTCDSMKLQASFDYSAHVTACNLHQPTVFLTQKEKFSLYHMDNDYEIIADKSLLLKDILFYSK